MLYALFDWLENTLKLDIPGAGVFQFLTFRAVLAAGTSLIIALFFGKRLILLLRKKQLGETIRELGPETHKEKAGTPTMGGLVIFGSIVIPCLLWGDLTSAYVWLILLATTWMAAIGFIDDYIKVFRKNKSGLKGKFKVFGQVSLGLIVGLVMVNLPEFNGRNLRLQSDGTLEANSYLRTKGIAEGDRLVSFHGYAYPQLYATPTFLDTLSVGSAKVWLTFEDQVTREQTRVKVDFDSTRKAIFGDGSLTTDALETDLPFIKTHRLDYTQIAFWREGGSELAGKIFYIFLAILIITAVSNGVNVTDGLDGLAAGTSAVAGLVFALFAYLSGNAIFSDYLNISFIPNGGELFVYASAFVGACIGFLWFNAYPAQVFMGDTGSLMLGSAIAVMALMVKKELLLPIICGVFAFEALSVILQVGWFKYTKRKHGEGRRIFRMAPLHHHYELQGWHEAKITVRLWIVSILLALLAFATLKLR